MSLLNSKFDIASVDNSVSLASLAQVLVSGTMSLGGNGTPVAGSFPPGAIVTMTNLGAAQLGTTTATPQLVFVTVDGDTDYSGSFVRKLTVLHGGVTIKTDQYQATVRDGVTALVYAPGDRVTFANGKITTLANAIAAAPAGWGVATPQVIGFVGPNGLDAANGVLEVILPQGAGV